MTSRLIPRADLDLVRMVATGSCDGPEERVKDKAVVVIFLRLKL